MIAAALVWLQSRLVEWLVLGLLAAMIFVNGCQHGESRAHEAAEAAQLKAAQTAQATLAQQFAKTRAAEARGEQLSAQLLQAQAQTRITYRTIRQEVPHVSYQVPNCPAGPVLLGDDFVQLWNTALDPDARRADMPAPASGADGAPPAPGAAGPAIELRDALANHVDNAEGCTAIRQQLEGLIEFYQPTGVP